MNSFSISFGESCEFYCEDVTKQMLVYLRIIPIYKILPGF